MTEKKRTLQQTLRAYRGVLADLLRAMRVEAGLQQIELAERLKRPQSYVSKVERSEKRVDLAELRMIGEALEVPMSTIIERFEAAVATFEEEEARKRG